MKNINITPVILKRKFFPQTKWTVKFYNYDAFYPNKLKIVLIIRELKYEPKIKKTTTVLMFAVKQNAVMIEENSDR